MGLGKSSAAGASWSWGSRVSRAPWPGHYSIPSVLLWGCRTDTWMVTTREDPLMDKTASYLRGRGQERRCVPWRMENSSLQFQFGWG